MNKICKFLTLIILIVAVLLFGIYQYRTFIQTEIYQENSEHLLATYEQVNRTFTLLFIGIPFIPCMLLFIGIPFMPCIP